MDVSSRVPAKGNDGSDILWEDGERLFCREQISSSDGKLKNILTVKLASEHPTPASIDRLAHEYALKDELDGAWAVRPLRLIQE
ncbi:MAG TPA: serine/threonine-protein kinase PknK, partial [Bradyrhizobium sp.]|nr:serine/threonine-protein kinase PknK [Bradyrhizobium sp.]